MPTQTSLPPIDTPLLRNFAELWLARCNGDRLPARADFSDTDLRPYFGHILIVDVVGGQRRFRFRLLGTSLADAAGRELTGKYFDEADITGYEPDVLDDYDEVVRCRGPVCKVRRFNPMPHVYADHWKSYERLLLPLAGNGKDIDKILGCSYPLGEAAQARISR